ncbi:hypothetical protein [Enterococcus sp. DIV0756]|uniref:hypothetical protein n=1 Tax=Enterococcus sp. DIV0756 TaxID=2774636 RepID=UPI003F278B5F
MKKIVVWSWRYLLVFSVCFISIIIWLVSAFIYGYAIKLEFWLFFPPLICIMLLVLSVQITTIKCNDQQLIIYNLGKFRKRVFNIRKIDVSFGSRMKTVYKIHPPPPSTLYTFKIEIRENGIEYCVEKSGRKLLIYFGKNMVHNNVEQIVNNL